MKTKTFIILGIVITAIVVGGILYEITMNPGIIASSNGYYYGLSNPVTAAINSNGDHLYVSFPSHNKVLEIDIPSMQELRRFDIDDAGYLHLDQSENLLYCISSGYPSYLNRINLSSGQTERIQITALATDFCFHPDGQTIWVISQTWPGEGEWYVPSEAYKHPESGMITEVDVQNFEIIQSATIKPLPVCIMYSSYTEMLYIWHAYTSVESEPGQNYITRNGNVIYETDPSRLNQGRHFITGPEIGLPGGPRVELWSDDGRYLAVPSPAIGEPPHSLMVFDLESWDYASEISVLMGNDLPFGTRFLHVVPNQNIIWATGFGGFSENPLDRPVIRINRVTEEIEVFPVHGVPRWGDFTVSPDGSTLYLTSPNTNEIIVWSPD